MNPTEKDRQVGVEVKKSDGDPERRSNKKKSAIECL
jgi:hypothetical protein